MTNKRGFTPILILLLVVILVSAGVIYYLGSKNVSFTPAPTASQAPTGVLDPTSGWQTYTGTSFSFKYPSNWQNLTDATGTDIALGFAVGNSPAGIYLTISTNKALDLSTLKVCDSTTTTFPCLNTQTTNTTLGGKTAVKADLKYGITDSDFQIVQTTGTPLIQLKMDVSGGGLTSTFDQILSTLKFTDVNQAANADLSTWKTYTNSGYSVKYPGDYFKFQDLNPDDLNYGEYVATSTPQGGNSPKFLGQNDVWLNTSSTENFYTSLDQYLTDQQDVYDDAVKTAVNIGGLQGFKISYSQQTDCAITQCTTVYGYDGLVFKSGALYIISLHSWNKSVLDADAKLFDQILSTFEFSN